MLLTMLSDSLKWSARTPVISGSSSRVHDQTNILLRCPEPSVTLCAWEIVG